MLFHITYTIVPEQRNTAQSRFKESGGLPSDGVTMHSPTSQPGTTGEQECFPD